MFCQGELTVPSYQHHDVQSEWLWCTWIQTDRPQASLQFGRTWTQDDSHVVSHGDWLLCPSFTQIVFNNVVIKEKRLKHHWKSSVKCRQVHSKLAGNGPASVCPDWAVPNLVGWCSYWTSCYVFWLSLRTGLISCTYRHVSTWHPARSNYKILGSEVKGLDCDLNSVITEVDHPRS